MSKFAKYKVVTILELIMKQPTNKEQDILL